MTVPTDYEKRLAGLVAEAASTPHAIDMDALRMLVADALAQHRARTLRLALTMIPRPTDSERSLDDMANGWTPRQVHELISAHRAIQLQLRRTRELLPATLGERPPE
jgi:ABC-type branched-subunit amino acid transport system ATPase component